ncbi:hypothetical protein XELAEV_18015537mg, partial [Xenopus laevis]
MKDFLTDQSKQSYLVGVPKTDTAKEHFQQKLYTYINDPYVGTGISPPVQLGIIAIMNWQEPGHSFALKQQVKTSNQKMVGSATKDCIGGHQTHVMQKKKNCLLQPVLPPSSSNDPPQNLNKTSSHKRQHTPCIQNFSATKLNAIQQKPTAYVRPMDGQEQATDESPKLKSSTEVNIHLPLCREVCHKTDKMKSDEKDSCSDLNQEE